MKQPIFVYYELDNFYQNHRRYDVLLRFPDNYLNLSLLHKLVAITFLMLKFYMVLLKLKCMIHYKLTTTLDMVLPNKNKRIALYWRLVLHNIFPIQVCKEPK
jgi:hypothetical protein